MRSLKYIEIALLVAASQAVFFVHLAFPEATDSAEASVHDLPALSVIAHAGARPLSVELNPKAPAQPIPAQDGAEVLRAIPGFNVIRKGGTDGDPVLRGMAGSRLGILIDGENVLGGCGMRMDPPTAYVFPSAHDRVTILKGPQTVLYGAGNSAGVVLFERVPRFFASPSAEVSGSLTAGGFGRRDAAFDFRAGAPLGQLQFVGTWSESDDYEDGAGHRVASAYERWSLHTALGWNPDEETLVELTGILSDGEAAYADRAMDGVAFERENIGFRFRRSYHDGWLREVEARGFTNYIDHVMDNFSLRPFMPTMMMPNKVVSNPDRETWGGRLLVRTDPEGSLSFVSGLDYQLNRHSVRRTMNDEMMPYTAMARRQDAEFSSWGFFSEATWKMTESARLVGGLRIDRHEATDYRGSVRAGMKMFPNPTSGHERAEILPSAFLRYEREWEDGWILHAGIGHTERFPDYWELFSKESANTVSAFETDPEQTTQLDIGLTRSLGQALFSISLFANHIEDFILIESQFEKAGPMGTRRALVSRSIDARTYGSEVTVSRRFAEHWLAEASLAYVHGKNRTDDHPLAQQPPLEARVNLRYEQATWSAGLLWRVVDEQDRFAVNEGNIVGQDLGPTPGFGIVSINGSWRPNQWMRLTAGIDNLFDKVYAEHLSRPGAMVAGFPPPSTRVNEPGRNWWIACNLSY
jgi:iron complex outermembrane receptor protein